MHTILFPKIEWLKRMKKFVYFLNYCTTRWKTLYYLNYDPKPLWSFTMNDNYKK